MSFLKRVRKPLGLDLSKWIIFLICTLAVVACFETKIPDNAVTGTSTTSGNPTEIQLGFADSSGPVNFSGQVEIFAATQVPVPGFQPDPLRSYSVVDKQQIEIKVDDLKSVADSLWPKSSREGDSLYRFNVVVRSPASGVILKDFGYFLDETSLMVPNSLRYDTKVGNAVGVKAELAPMVAYSVAMRKDDLADNKDHFLFLAGTGLVAKNDSTIFKFQALPKGVYQPSYLGVWQKGHGPQGTSDSVGVYNLSLPFNTSKQDTLSLDAERERIYLPLDLRGN